MVGLRTDESKCVPTLCFYQLTNLFFNLSPGTVEMGAARTALSGSAARAARLYVRVMNESELCLLAFGGLALHGGHYLALELFGKFGVVGHYLLGRVAALAELGALVAEP